MQCARFNKKRPIKEEIVGFLYCAPAVCVIGGEYEILVCAKEDGIFSVKIGADFYYEENCGVLCSERRFAKIRVPQSVLNRAGEYEVVYRKTQRKAYFSVLGAPMCKNFVFSAPKSGKLNLYHVADVHGRFELARRCCSFFGNETDLFIVNGDIGEVECEQDYLDSLNFLADIAKGEIPIVFTRGNHDTRGKFAEKFSDYFPADGKNTYYDFTFADLYGIVFDCGEDKADVHREYGGDGLNEFGVNRFEDFRRRETEFLKSLVKQDRFTLAIGHIPPVQASFNVGDEFDIERETYRRWNEEFERLDVRMMICGHMHKAYILKADDQMNLLPHRYPVVVGSACGFGGKRETLTGAAVTLCGGRAEVWFNDSDGNKRKVL